MTSERSKRRDFLSLIFISKLTECSKQKEKRIQAASLYDKCNDGDCSTLRSFFRPKRQLVRYPDRKTMGNNDKQ